MRFVLVFVLVLSACRSDLQQDEWTLDESEPTTTEVVQPEPLSNDGFEVFTLKQSIDHEVARPPVAGPVGFPGLDRLCPA